MDTEVSPGVTARSAVVADLHELDRSLLHGIAWTSGAKWVGQLVAWASTLIVARLLTPEDYGLVGMASIYLGLITLVSDFGLGSAVITLRDLSEEQVAQLNGLAVLFGVASCAVSCAAAIPLGHFFHAPQLPAVVVAMSAALVITAFKTVPFSLLQREMRFRTLAFIETWRAVLLAVSMIGFAVFGLRYWTLVIGGLLSSALSTAGTVLLRRHRFAWPRRESLAHAMTFSKHILVGQVSWYAYSNADFLVAGRILGKGALGLYDLAWTLAYIPVEKMTALVTQVTPTFFAALQRDLAALRRYLLSITEGLALITFPVCLGMALVAHDFVLLFLGDKWEGAIVPLRLLALSAGLRSITPLPAQVLNVVGESRFGMRCGAVMAVVLPGAFYLMGTRWGTEGLALAWLLVFPLLMLPLYLRVFARMQLTARAYLRALWPAASASLVMGCTVLAVEWAVGQHASRAAQFTAEVTSGAAVYVLTCLLLHRERITAFRRAVRLSLGASAPAGDAKAVA